jgi:hypothetical protein
VIGFGEPGVNERRGSVFWHFLLVAQPIPNRGPMSDENALRIAPAHRATIEHPF